MADYTGNYTRGGDPEAMFDEENRYLGALNRPLRAAVDADFNEGLFSTVTQLRRIIQNSIGDGSPNNGFLIAESGGSTTNNFTITGGDGTDEGAGRLFSSGFGCMLKSDVDYSGTYDARMKMVMPQITGLTALVLTDATANWTVDEHAGNTLTPNVELDATVFTIVSNTATTITIGAGDMTLLAAFQDFYRIELSTPSGGARVDEVYLDVFWDEVDENEDPNLVHPTLLLLGAPQSAANRLVVRQFVRIKEGGATPADFTDSTGRDHYTLKIATLARPDATAAVLTAQITDDRPTFTAGAPQLLVEEIDLSPSIQANTLRFPIGSLTDLGGGVVEVAGSGGGGVSLGFVTFAPAFTRDITAVTAPSNGIVGTDTDTLDYPDFATTGQKFEFHVPDDYGGGDLVVHASYLMSTAVGAPNNNVVLEGSFEVFDVSGGSSTLLPVQQITHPTPINQDIIREPLFTLAEADFELGDTVQIFVRRLGNDGFDWHTGEWRVLSFGVQYTSTISQRTMTENVEFLRTTDEPAPVPVIVGTDTHAESYPTGSDAEQKFSFHVPENWDGIQGPVVRLVYSMSSAAVGTVRLATEGEISDVSGGAVVPVPIQNFDLVPPVDTSVRKTLIIRQLDPAILGAGDLVTLKIARRVGVGGNHAGDFQLIGVSVQFAFATSNVSPTEEYLELAVFGNQVGLVDGDTLLPDPSIDFETLDEMTSTSAAGRIDAFYQGRLSTFHTTIQSLQVGIRGLGGSPQYRLRVFAEGSGGTPVFDSGLLAAPGALTVTTITDLDLSAQPVASKRYLVLVEAHIDNAEGVQVSRPFVREV